LTEQLNRSSVTCQLQTGTVRGAKLDAVDLNPIARALGLLRRPAQLSEHFLVPLWVQNPKPVHDAHELTDLRNLCNAGEPLDLTAGNRANSSR
jgi:hypothetical protein